VREYHLDEPVPLHQLGKVGRLVQAQTGESGQQLKQHWLVVSQSEQGEQVARLEGTEGG
jgi:hypothetical protein